MTEATHRTADLCDRHPEGVQVAQGLLRHFGGKRRFHGQIATLKVFEDLRLVHQALAEPGFHRVLVVDGGASLRRALMGEHLAALAHRHHWAGIVVNGAVRHVAALETLDIGIMALGHTPLHAPERGDGTHTQPVAFAGVVFRPGEWLYADEDGIVLGADRLA